MKPANPICKCKWEVEDILAEVMLTCRAPEMSQTELMTGRKAGWQEVVTQQSLFIPEVIALFQWNKGPFLSMMSVQTGQLEPFASELSSIMIGQDNFSSSVDPNSYWNEATYRLFGPGMANTCPDANGGEQRSGERALPAIPALPHLHFRCSL